MKFVLVASLLALFFADLAVASDAPAAGSGKNGWTYRTTASTCAATYGNPCGEEYWEKISATCSTGKIQTPIDFSNVVVDTTLLQPVLTATNGGCKTWVQFSTNYTFEVAFQDSGYVCNNLQVSYNGQTYTMQQIHFHTPSEHTIGGGYFSGEAHMVHKSSAGSLLVLGVFLQVSANNLRDSNNTFFEGLWEVGGASTFSGAKVEIPSTSGITINPYNGLLPGRFSNYRYTGSLTTPPCTEGVQWFVFDQPIQISQYDLTALRKAAAALKTTTVSEFGNTNRAIQSTNGRSVLYNAGAVPNQYVAYDDDGTQNQKKDERLAIAAIVLSSFSTLVTILLSVWVSIVSAQVLSGGGGGDGGRPTAVGLEMGNKAAGGNAAQYSAVEKADAQI